MLNNIKYRVRFNDLVALCISELRQSMFLSISDLSNLSGIDADLLEAYDEMTKELPLNHLYIISVSIKIDLVSLFGHIRTFNEEKLRVIGVGISETQEQNDSFLSDALTWSKDSGFFAKRVREKGGYTPIWQHDKGGTTIVAMLRSYIAGLEEKKSKLKELDRLRLQESKHDKCN